jgi:hypothetical protein
MSGTADIAGLLAPVSDHVRAFLGGEVSFCGEHESLGRRLRFVGVKTSEWALSSFASVDDIV